MTTWQAKLKKATWAVFTGLFDADGWEGLYKAGKEFLWYLFVFVMRIVMILTFPVSIPILCVAYGKQEMARLKAREEIRMHLRPLSDRA